MGGHCIKTNGGQNGSEEENIDRKKKDIKNFKKEREDADNKINKKVMMEIAVSDVDRDCSSSRKPSLAGMHRGTSLVSAGRPQGTIVSMKSNVNNKDIEEFEDANNGQENVE